MLFLCFALVTWICKSLVVCSSHWNPAKKLFPEYKRRKSWGRNSFAEWIILNFEENGRWNDEWQQIQVFILLLSSLLWLYPVLVHFSIFCEWSVQLIWKILLAGEVYGVAAGELIVSYSVAGTTKWSSSTNCSIWFLLLLVLHWEQKGERIRSGIKKMT